MDNPIKCLVLKDNKPLTYDLENKFLFLADKGFTVFESKHKARSAIHHTVEAQKIQGIESPHLLYTLEEC